MADLVWVRIFSQTSRLELEIFSLTYNGVRFFFFSIIYVMSDIFFSAGYYFSQPYISLQAFPTQNQSTGYISAVNFIVEWKLFPFSTELSTLVFHRENTSSMYLFQKSGLIQLCFTLVFRILAMKMLAATAIFVPLWWLRGSVGSCYRKIGTSFLLIYDRAFLLDTWWA